MRIVVLVDGEHHPTAVRSALAAIAERGDEICAAVFCGGIEKVDLERLDDAYGVPVLRDDDVAAALDAAIAAYGPDAVLDLTDEPVLSPDDRFGLASRTLARDVSYSGADFDLRPPRFPRIVSKPSVRVFATGKRTGKTAVASALARRAAAQGHSPVIVAIGRGGPNPPRVIEAGALLDVQTLLGFAEQGLHASSDYIEDALTSGVTTIGCMRVGGGLAGATVHSNLVSAAELAERRPEDLVIFEGSGASVPEVAAKAGVICVPATIDPARLRAYLNPYRLLLADLAVVTMAEQRSEAAAIQAAIQGPKGIRPELEVLPVMFRPEPLASVEGRKVFFCCTAPSASGSVLKAHLEQIHGCEVVGISHNLADRSALVRELADAPDHDLVLVELKAAGVDVVARAAAADRKDVVFVNNEIVGAGVEEAFERVLSLAVRRESPV